MENTAWNSECEKAHGDNWRKWLGHLKDKPARGLELGTFMGESAEWMLEYIFTHPESRYVCVDTFEGSPEHHLIGFDCSKLEQQTKERLSRFGVRASINRSRTDAFLVSGISRGCTYFDFVYVDAAHDAMNVIRDAVLAFELLKVGGVMIFDDYQWTVMKDAVDCPKLAIDSFIRCYARRLKVIGVGYQVAVMKMS